MLSKGASGVTILAPFTHALQIRLSILILATRGADAISPMRKLLK
jgi:hypothetical protein